ncbi:MAG: hypothetical protein HY314_11700 [Acidobacteria bacterium]|nr:hypothetical protein [Acidobacteriota bacterium]
MRKTTTLLLTIVFSVGLVTVASAHPGVGQLAPQHNNFGHRRRALAHHQIAEWRSLQRSPKKRAQPGGRLRHQPACLG